MRDVEAIEGVVGNLTNVNRAESYARLGSASYAVMVFYLCPDFDIGQ